MNSSEKKQQTPLLTGTSVSAKRAELKQYFRQTWASYESLFSLINSDDAYYLRPEPLRHPLIFYYGHTATFYINKLILGKYLAQRINEKLEAICAVGVDEMSWDDLSAEHYDWPGVDEVRAYRRQVAAVIEQLIDTMALVLPITQHSLAWIMLMGCEHERIHLETSSVIMRMLPLEYLTPDTAWSACSFSGIAPENQLLEVSGKTLVLGKPDSDATFGWDNEYGELPVTVDNFNASKYLVSNQEFLAFVNAGGYRSPPLWTEEGQQWLAYSKATMPRFWRQQDGQFFQRNLLAVIALPMNWPVEVNYLEAKAFCQWRSRQSQRFIRLPTEAEWYCLRDKIATDLVNWQEAPGNINLEYFASSCPVDRFETDGFFDITGNVWQWTESEIDGFNGFTVHPLYDDFSTPTFDGRHNLIKGGSWISTGNEACKHSRYAFRRHFFQHAGFRYIDSDSTVIPKTEVNSFETDQQLCQQLESHYGEDYLNQGNYGQHLAQRVLALAQKYRPGKQKLLDLGCSVGRCSFELASYFELIDGVDFSARYIQHPVRLQQVKPVRYTLITEGELLDFKEVNVQQFGFENSGNILFSQGDACNLKAQFSGYDVILAQQVLEQSYDPGLFLDTIHQRLKANGMLILVSDYQFNAQHTRKHKWLGGIKVNGENMSTLEGIAKRLTAHFTLLEQQEIIRVTRISARNFSVSKLQLTAWQLR